MRPIKIDITINFPALSALVDYFNGAQQAQIDALSAKVQDLTSSLSQSSTGLQGVVDNNQPQ